MPCQPTTARQSSPTRPTATPPAVTEPTAADGLFPASTTASPSAPGSAMGAAGNTTTAPPSHAQAQALQALTQMGLLSASLYSSLFETPNPTRQQAADWLRMARQMHRHAQRSVVDLVDVLTAIITERDEEPKHDANLTDYTEGMQP